MHAWLVSRARVKKIWSEPLSTSILYVYRQGDSGETVDAETHLNMRKVFISLFYRSPLKIDLRAILVSTVP